MNLSTGQASKKLFLGLALLSTLFLSACGDKGKNKFEIPGVNGPNVQLIDEDVVVTMTIEQVDITESMRYEVDQLPNSYIEVAQLSDDGGIAFTASLSLEDILGPIDMLDPHALPGGRPLPGVNGGQLPSVAVRIEKLYNTTVYVGREMFGFFVPFYFGVDNTIVSYRYYIGDAAAGIISAVGRDGNEDETAGILLLLDISDNKVRDFLRKRMLKYRG